MSDTLLVKMAADLGVEEKLLAKLDPYFLAAWANGFADYQLPLGGDGQPLYPLAGVLAWSAEAEFASSPVLEQLDLQDLLTAQGYDAQDRARFFTADVNKAQLVALLMWPCVTELQLCAVAQTTRPTPCSPLGKVAGSSAKKAPPVSDKKKIIGLMDHGCAFAHQHLRATGAAVGTRVLAIWDQDPHPEFDPTVGTVPAVRGLRHGRQVDRGALNGYLGVGTDREVYRAARYSALESDYTHGTLTLGLLAGQFLSPSLVPSSGLGQPAMATDMNDVDIVFVQIPRAVGLCPNRGSVDRVSYDALRYMLACTPDGAELVVVIDYGTELGPHDGSSWFERAVDQLVCWAHTKHGITLRVVFPSGNGHDTQRHAKMGFASAGTSSVYWDIPYGNGAAAHTEIWFPHDMPHFTVSLLRPGQATPLQITAPSEAWPWVGVFAGGTMTATLQNGQVSVLLTVDATETKPHLAGRWCIGVKSTSAHKDPVCLYTAWGGQNPGFVQRQWPCRFELARLDKTDVLPTIDGAGSLLGSACGQATSMVGGYEKYRPYYRASYCAGGASRGGKRVVMGADALCVTEEAVSLLGVLTLGSLSGPWYRAAGTSFAAPQWARAGLSAPLITTPSPALPQPYFGMGKPRAEYGEPRL